MSRGLKPALFSEEAQRLILERIRNLSDEEWDRMVAWRPEGWVDDGVSIADPLTWPSRPELVAVSSNGRKAPAG